MDSHLATKTAPSGLILCQNVFLCSDLLCSQAELSRVFSLTIRCKIHCAQPDPFLWGDPVRHQLQSLLVKPDRGMPDLLLSRTGFG